MDREPIRKLRLFVEAVQNKLKQVDKTIDRGVQGLLGAALNASNSLNKAEKTVLEATQDLIEKILHQNINEGDTLQGSTPYKKRLNTEIDTKKIDEVLEKLGFDKYSKTNAIKFFDEETKYWKMTEGFFLLEDSLKHFGVPDNLSGEEKLMSSLAHKDFIRNHLNQTLKKPLPEDPSKRNKIIAFQIFAFANADLLIGKLKYQQERYQSYITAAVKNSNILPLVMMKELAGISPRKAFSSEASFEKLIKKARNPEIANYLKKTD